MAKYSAKNAVIQITYTGTVMEISPDVEAYEITGPNYGLEDVSGFGQAVNVVAGQADWEVSLDCWYNDSATGTWTIFNETAGEPVTLTIKPSGVSGKVFAGTMVHGGIAVAGESNGGGIKLGTVTFKQSGSTEPTWT
jgi:hypothetical protein